MSNVGDVVMDDDVLKIVTNNGSLATIGPFPNSSVTVANTMTSGTFGSTITARSSFDIDEILEQHIMNRVTIDHKVAEHELMKLKEVAPDYANEIKENLSKNATRDIIKKMTFTKKFDKDADTHHFIGRVWVFTEEELKTFINEVRNA